MSAAFTQTEVILSFDECLRIIAQHAAEISRRSFGTTVVPLLASVGAVLAEDLYADRDIPPFRRSARDGFACRAADISSVPVALRVVMHVAAGSEFSRHPITGGEAAEIMTGAPVPDGTDCVVMREHVEESGAGEVRILRSAKIGENVVPKGAEGREGDVLLRRRSRISYPGIALAAALGKRELRVCEAPKVAILATGDELVPLEQPPAPHQIRNSNSYSTAAQVIAVGGRPVLLPIVPDDRECLRTSIRTAFDYDLLLLMGGVSVGKHDLVEEVLSEFDAEFLFTGALIQPGKPVVFARLPRNPFPLYCFGLPGNPISTMVTFETFVRPLLDALAGAQPELLPFASAALARDMTVKSGLTRFIPGRLGGDLNQPTVDTVQWQGSGDIVARARANCYIVIPPDRTQLKAGEWVTVLLA